MTDLCAGAEHDMDADFQGPWTVTVVMADLAYGGPEEGGWYYDTYDPFNADAAEFCAEVKGSRLFWDRSEAVAWLRELQQLCESENTASRRPPKHSVASRGVFEARVFSGWPRRIPEATPRYE